MHTQLSRPVILGLTFCSSLYPAPSITAIHATKKLRQSVGIEMLFPTEIYDAVSTPLARDGSPPLILSADCMLRREYGDLRPRKRRKHLAIL